MKNKLLLIIQSAILTAVAATVFTVAAEPGGTDDPVVSKSYVDGKITELLNTLEAGGTINVNPSAQADTSKLKYTPVHVGVGQRLLGAEGTELILRVGRSFAVVPTESLIDVTSGTEIKDKGELKKNHVIIVPRNDGRGVRVVEDAWFLVKGEYTIQ